jgi:hypothetical protein
MIGDFCSKLIISIKIALKKQICPKISQKENCQVEKICANKKNSGIGRSNKVCTFIKSNVTLCLNIHEGS